MSFRRFLCCFGRSSNKVVDTAPTLNPKKHLELFHSWVMDLRMGIRPAQLTQKEIMWVVTWKKHFEEICIRVKDAYGTYKVNEYIDEYEKINASYIGILRDYYRKNQLEVKEDLLKTSSIRQMLGLSVRWYS